MGIQQQKLLLVLFTYMLRIKNSAFGLQYNQDEDDCYTSDFTQIEQKIVPGSIWHIDVQDLDNFEQGVIDLPLELYEKVYRKICEVLQTCPVNYLFILNSFRQKDLLLKLVQHVSRYCRLITGVDFIKTNFRDQGVKILCESLLIFIKVLILNQSNISDKGVVLLTNNIWNYLNILDLSHNRITNFGLHALMKSQSMPRLRQLRLDNIRSTRDGLKMFSKMGWALTTLSLNLCEGNAQMTKIMSQKSCISLSLIKLRQQMQLDNCYTSQLYVGWMAKIQLHGIQRNFCKPIFLFYGCIRGDKLKNDAALINLKKRMILH